MVDINTAVRFVDEVTDGNPKTTNYCPGHIDGRKLIQIGIQKERRILKKLFKKVKHIIYLQEGTRLIWYKNNECYPAVVKMGFSMSELTMHPKAVPMETYAMYFLDNKDPAWLKRNDFVLT